MDRTKIEVVLNSNGMQRTFDGTDDFAAWLTAERERWDWLGKARSQVPQLKPVINVQLNVLATSVNEIAAARDNAERHIAVATTNAAKLSEAGRSRRLLLSEDAAGAFVLTLASEKPIEAGYALAYLLRIPVQDPDPNVTGSFEGRFRAATYELGLGEGAIAEKSTLVALRAEYLQHIEKLRLDTAAALMEYSRRLQELVEQTKKNAEDFEQHKALIAAAAEKQIDKQETEFAQLRSAFLDFMKLNAPVQYWTKSALWHRVVAAVFGAGAVVWGVTVAVNVVSYTQDLLKVNGAGPALGSPANPPLWQLGLLLFLVTLAVWLLRVLVRMMLSNLHQGADAASRGTMTQAYLALLKEGGALTEKDRILVLTTLFRPMATGLIKDDGMPPSLVELLSRVVGGSKS